MAAAVANAGDSQRALTIADQIAQPGIRAGVLAEVAECLADAEQHLAAEQLLGASWALGHSVLFGLPALLKMEPRCALAITKLQFNDGHTGE